MQLLLPLDVAPRPGELITITPRLFSSDAAPYPSFYKGTILLLDSARAVLSDVHIHCSATMTLLELGGEGVGVRRGGAEGEAAAQRVARVLELPLRIHAVHMPYT